MKGDNSRVSFRVARRFAAVRMQQGRVALDQDWNESVDIADHLRRSAQTDLVGPVGAPWDPTDDPVVDRGFLRVGNGVGARHFAVAADGPDLVIAPGRMHVHGLLCENLDGCTLADQPDHRPVGAPTLARGTYLIWLDAWMHHVCPAEDPSLLEPALGGPDTATRSRVVWQARAERLVDTEGGWDADTYAALWAATADWETARAAVEAPTGTLEAGLEPPDPVQNPCLLPADAGYRRLTHQLYRVEVHRAGRRGADGEVVPDAEVARFKWNRDNGSDTYGVVAIVRSASATTLTLAVEPRDDERAFHSGEIVEVFDDRHVYGDAPAALFRVTSAQGTEVVGEGDVGFGNGVVDFANAQVRRWHPSSPDATPSEGIRVDSGDVDGWIVLEDGVRVRFGEGTFEVGDHWTIPARSLSGELLWPPPGTTALAQPPEGVERRHARLAFATWDGEEWEVLQDLRPRFPVAADAWTLHWTGEAVEREDVDGLLRELSARVLCGGQPVRGAPVEFRVDPGDGGLGTVLGGGDPEAQAFFPLDTGETASTQVFVYTDEHGLAWCQWRPGNPGDRVVARLRTEDGRPTEHTLQWIHQPAAEAVAAAAEEGVSILRISATWLDQGARRPVSATLGLDDTLSVASLLSLTLTIRTAEPVSAGFLPPADPEVGPDPRVNVRAFLPDPWVKLGPAAYREVYLPGLTSVGTTGALVWALDPQLSLERLLRSQEVERLRLLLTVECDHVLAGAKGAERHLAGGPCRDLPRGDGTPLTAGPPGGTFRFWFQIAPGGGVKGEALSVDLEATEAAMREAEERARRIREAGTPTIRNPA